MFNWKHWRLTIDGVTTDFELTDNDFAELAGYDLGVPLADMHEAMRRWNDAGTTDAPHGWVHDVDANNIDLWVRNPEQPGELIAVSVFSDALSDTLTVYDLSFIAAAWPDAPVKFSLGPYFPELEKQSSIIEEANAISGFINNLPDDVSIAKLDYESSVRGPIADPATGKDIEELLADHFELDLKQIEVERRALLEYLGTQMAKG